MPNTFQIGDTLVCTINSRQQQFTWVDAHTLRMEPGFTKKIISYDFDDRFVVFHCDDGPWELSPDPSTPLWGPTYDKVLQAVLSQNARHDDIVTAITIACAWYIVSFYSESEHRATIASVTQLLYDAVPKFAKSKNLV
jgi:hypothetical protein